MNVLSLFDGMSCGQLALKRAGIQYDHYYASEIDKWAIKITQKNFPNTIQLGDVTQIKGTDLPTIDLLLGGSPCQGFSKAGGQLNFDDPRSKLFFEYVRVLNETKPSFFLFENVNMKKEWQQVINGYLGVEPVRINSALVSAQNRDRLYWTNIPDIIQPEDRGIYLKDIIEHGFVDRDKSYCVDANYYKGGSLKHYLEKSVRQIVMHQSEKRLMVKEIQGAAYRNQETNRGREFQLNIRQDGKSNAVVPSFTNRLNGCVQIGTIPYIGGHDYNRRVYSPEGKSPTVVALNGGHQEVKISTDNITWRKLTPLECERLQTVPDNYTEGVSNTQRYRMLGNGWTVEVIAHILKNILHHHDQFLTQHNNQYIIEV